MDFDRRHRDIPLFNKPYFMDNEYPDDPVYQKLDILRYIDGNPGQIQDRPVLKPLVKKYHMNPRVGETTTLWCISCIAGIFWRKFRDRQMTETEYIHLSETSLENLAEEFSKDGRAKKLHRELTTRKIG
ncbi:MAG: hypothetical protein RL557_585 [archaeon]